MSAQNAARVKRILSLNDPSNDPALDTEARTYGMSSELVYRGQGQKSCQYSKKFPMRCACTGFPLRFKTGTNNALRTCTLT